MQKMLLIVAIMLISSCSAFVVNHLNDENKSLYSYNIGKTTCNIHPDKCINSDSQT